MKHAVLTCLALALLAMPLAAAACKWCSDQYEVSDKLAEMGLEVKYMGKALTEYLKSEASVMVF